MDMKRFFLYFMMIAALALAGCGGGGGMGPGTGDDTDTDTPSAGPTTAALFAMAQDLGDNSTTYATATTDAVEAAMENSVKLDVISVAGDSSMAKANAEQVLAAEMTANNAVDRIMTALDAAKSALANDVDADGAQADALTRALEQAIMVAEEQLEAAKMAAEGDDLKTAVEAVTGNDPEAEGYPTTSTQIGAGVAMQVGMALMPVGPTDGGGMRVDHGAVAPTMDTDPGETAVKMNNHKGMTWAEIVGEANIMKMRIATSGTDTDLVDAASVSDMTFTTTETANDDVDDGTQLTLAYKGIAGTVFCAGDCAVEEVADDDAVRKLTGGWYFTPSVEDTWYMGTTTEGVTTYSAETLYVRFGHWLSVNDDDDTLIDIDTYAMTGGNTGNLALNVNTDEGATTLTDTSATYNGMAAGMSLHKEVDSDNMPLPGTLQSGAFTAAVTLTATFGTAPTLGGTVSKFQSENGGAVDPLWSVNLLQRGFTGANFTDGTTVVTGGQPGEWSAQAYGNANERPEGIFGGFTAHFSDGHAAGAYATRK